MVPPSDKLEDAFSNVANLYLRHQHAWDNADEITEYDENMDESEPESDDSDVEPNIYDM